jgi:hypothetical protein
MYTIHIPFKKILAATLAFVFVFSALTPLKTSALSGSDFRHGRIIDNAVFNNPGSMNVYQIQAFLDTKVPTCDTNGTQPSGHGSYTRAQWGALNNNPAPYTCLKSYTENVPYMAADTYCGGDVAPGTRGAAQIIADVSRACGTSPQVLLVLLQKEQSLITDDWPWVRQYQAATGFACPDTASCNPAYAGFFKQIYYGARQYQRYAKEPQNFTYKAGRDNYIQYNPNANCGGAAIYLENQATAGLYNYTPYIPNSPALNNLYGTGDDCSAYGNRNFWRLFNDWFGPAYANCILPSQTGNEVFRILQPSTSSYMLTSDPYEVCMATSSYGYTYDGSMFFNMAGTSGTVPVYRLVKNGKYLFTVSAAERDNAISKYGFSQEGAAFYASPTYTTATPLAIYRLNNPSTGAYLYSTSSAERDDATNNGFVSEGVAFYVDNQSPAQDVYRLSNVGSGYLYTISGNERDNASKGYGFNYEGIAFNTWSRTTDITLPIYRLAGPRGYIYTASLAERKYAMSVGYRSEGISYWGYASDSTNGTKPIYRLVNNGVYLFTASSTERDNAAAQYGYRYEGIAFRLP